MTTRSSVGRRTLLGHVVGPHALRDWVLVGLRPMRGAGRGRDGDRSRRPVRARWPSARRAFADDLAVVLLDLLPLVEHAGRGNPACGLGGAAEGVTRSAGPPGGRATGVAAWYSACNGNPDLPRPDGLPPRRCPSPRSRARWRAHRIEHRMTGPAVVSHRPDQARPGAPVLGAGAIPRSPRRPPAPRPRTSGA